MSLEHERLEGLWAGEFGSAYTERNKVDWRTRALFWANLATRYNIRTALEVGCNTGANLRCLQIAMDGHMYGVDVNRLALREGRVTHPQLNLVYGIARELPFKDRHFNMTFTCGVLIHQPEESLKAVMSEVVRCSHKYVLCMEYFAEKREEVFYRGVPGSLWRDDYAKHYQEWFLLKPVESGFLPKDKGFDDVTWTLMELPV